MKTLLSLACLAALLLGPLEAKRAAPPSVPPLVAEGVRYECPSSPLGLVEAYDVATGRRLWTRQVFATVYDPKLESDVQDRFIRTLRIREGKLIVEVEEGRVYSLDPKTLAVAELAPKPGR